MRGRLRRRMFMCSCVYSLSVVRSVVWRRFALPLPVGVWAVSARPSVRFAALRRLYFMLNLSLIICIFSGFFCIFHLTVYSRL